TGRLPAPEGAEGRRIGRRPARGSQAHLLHRPRRLRRAAPVARWLLGRRPGRLQAGGGGEGLLRYQRGRTVSATTQIAPVHKAIVVAASTQRAFEVFTAGMDRWWPRSHGIGRAPIRRVAIEPFVGGRWYNDLEDGSQVTIGHVRVWEPGTRFVVGWEISAHWK